MAQRTNLPFPDAKNLYQARENTEATISDVQALAFGIHTILQFNDPMPAQSEASDRLRALFGMLFDRIDELEALHQAEHPEAEIIQAAEQAV